MCVLDSASFEVGSSDYPGGLRGVDGRALPINGHLDLPIVILKFHAIGDVDWTIEFKLLV
jgi:hypothetical protein